MNIYAAFNIPVRITPATPRTFGPKSAGEEEKAPIDGPGRSVGAFITVQSLVSFTGATGAISLLWSAIKAMGIVPLSFNIYVGVLLSLIIGMFIYYINITDPNTQYTYRDKVIGFFIAFLNSLVLFNATKSIVGS